MERKNYLYEKLTEEEIKYLRGIIWKSARKCKRNNYYKDKFESESIFSENIDERLLMVEDKYEFFNRVLESQTTKAEIKLKPYTAEEQKNIVKLLDNIAYESGLEIYVKQLTFKEKLVVFLLYIKDYKVNEVASLLKISRKTINYRDNCIKAKFKIVKGLIENGK